VTKYYEEVKTKSRVKVVLKNSIWQGFHKCGMEMKYPFSRD